MKVASMGYQHEYQQMLILFVLRQGSRFWQEVLEWGESQGHVTHEDRDLLTVAAAEVLPDTRQCEDICGVYLRLRQQGLSVPLHWEKGTTDEILSRWLTSRPVADAAEFGPDLAAAPSFRQGQDSWRLTPNEAAVAPTSQAMATGRQVWYLNKLFGQSLAEVCGQFEVDPEAISKTAAGGLIDLAILSGLRKDKSQDWLLSAEQEVQVAAGTLVLEMPSEKQMKYLKKLWGDELARVAATFGIKPGFLTKNAATGLIGVGILMGRGTGWHARDW